MTQALERKSLKTKKKKRLSVISIQNPNLRRKKAIQLRKKRARNRKIVLTMCLGISLFLIVQTIVGYTTIAGLNSQISTLQSDIRSMEAERDYAGMQLEPYTNNGRIETIAQQRLKMSAPKGSQIRTISAHPNKFVEKDVMQRVPHSNFLDAIVEFFKWIF